jgi:hypothetical protein
MNPMRALAVVFSKGAPEAGPARHEPRSPGVRFAGASGFLLATVPVVALMPARPIAPVLITIYVCIGTLQHANLRWTFGPAGRVLVSPAYHRLHHAPETQDVNLGVVLTIWDALAGLARFPSRADALGRTGLDGRPVPVEQDDSAGSALLLLAEQLAEPFQAHG